MRKQFSMILLLACAIVMGEVEKTTYDLIRPMWPEAWDSTVLNTFVPGPKRKSLPTSNTPRDYVPNSYIPDTLNQAYLDAMNIQISPIRVNQAGYRPNDQKLIYYVGDATTFEVVNLQDSVLQTGSFETTPLITTGSSITIKASNNAQNTAGGDNRYSVAATGPSGNLLRGFLPDGLPVNTRLRVRVGTNLSATFIISDDVYGMVRDAALKFFGVNRSGNSESWFHPASHTLDGMTGGSPGALAGGWYDCGDHLKESQTMSYAFMTLALMAAALETRDVDHYGYNHSEIDITDGVPDILREAKHGADFVLKAWDFSGGDPLTMPVSVGNFGADHGWWGRPEYQDNLPSSVKGRGGPHERDLRSDQSDSQLQLGSTAGGDFAAGLAIISKLWARYDTAYANKALVVAKAIYEYGKSVKALTNSAAYSGGSTYHDEMGLAAICLLYATGDSYYLNDAVEDVSLVTGTQTKQSFINSDKRGAGMFNGGWFAHKEASYLKSGANTDWASVYTHGLYAFYKLILETESKAASYGISPEQRMIYVEDVALTMAANLGARSGGWAGSIPLPVGQASWSGMPAAGFDPVWFTMATQQTWIYNRYQAGNIFEVLAYADVAKDLEGMTMPQTAMVQDWKAAEMFQLGVDQMGYLLGINPWDISMVIGVGDKNHSHPHHRGANPEGKNVPGAIYSYRPPVGALFGGVVPVSNGPSDIVEHYDDYHVTEVCLDASASFIPSAIILAKEEDLNRGPEVTVEIKYVGFDSAIVMVRQDMLGSTVIHYGLSPDALTESVASSSTGVVHTFSLKPLKNGTIYYFTATSSNVRSGNTTTRYLVDSTLTPYTFTTLSSPPASANIQNVKVCNVSADSAEIMWYTPNGEYGSKIYWDTILTSYDKMRWSQDGDINGVPTKFHRMKIGGLQEKTVYYFAVESDGERRALDTEGQPLKFRTPVTQYDFSVRTSMYDWAGMTAIEMNIYNNEGRPFDSLTVRVYMRGTDEIETDIGIRMDICQAYDEAGFNKPCSPETITELTGLFRLAKPTKLPDTYNAADGTWQWYFPIPLGSTVIKSSSRMRIDVVFDQRSPWPPYLDLMNHAPDKKVYCHDAGSWYSPGLYDTDINTAAKLGSNPGDWSWMPHSKANGEPVNYGGMPCYDKDFGDADVAPINPYVTVYRKDEFVWGFSPSYSEQVTKVTDYELISSLESPFNVSNGSYIEIDGTSSRIWLKGSASVSDAGVITDIWVNGEKVADLSSVAVYNEATDLWDLNIPLKLKIGPNKVDVTIFAGPDLACEVCQQNGGCAFDNYSFFVLFSKGDMTASSLTITDVNTGVSVASPAIPGATQFHIQVIDGDKLKNPPPYLDVLVINARKQDTTIVKLTLNTALAAFVTSAPVSAISAFAEKTGDNQIAFFGGDTIEVIYIDPDDPEDDISRQTFFAEPAFPSLSSAVVLDTNCDGVMDRVDLTFDQAFDPGDGVDTLWMRVQDPQTQVADSFALVNTQSMEGLSVLNMPIPPRLTLPVTGAPSGSMTAYIRPQGTVEAEKSSVALTDGILPFLEGVSLLENPNHESVYDTLKVTFSEPVILASAQQWPLALVVNGTMVNTASLAVEGRATTDDNGVSWLYVVSGNTGGLLIDSGYIASIAATFQVTDYALNALDPVGGCVTSVIISEEPKPVPINWAVMQDQNQDGTPDLLKLRFARKLREKDMLDSFVVKWGNPALTRSILPLQPRTWTVVNDTTSHLDVQRDALGNVVYSLPDSTPVKVRVIDTISVVYLTWPDGTFPYGTTHGANDGLGSVTPRLGVEGGFFDRSYVVNDSVGPVVISAQKSVTWNGMDSLGVVLSEPIDTLDAFILERRRGDVVEPFMASYTILFGEDSLVKFFYDSETPGEVRVGDYVRLIVTSPKAKDKAGNNPPIYSPWIEVVGSSSSKIKVDVEVQKPVTGLDPETASPGYTMDPPDSNAHFRVTALKENQETKIAEGKGFQFANATLSYDTSYYSHLGPTFDVRIQLPGSLIEQNGGPVWNYVMTMNLMIYDNLGQFVNQIEMYLDVDKLRPYLSSDGSLVLRVEWMMLQNSPRSAQGRPIASGAYIGSFDFEGFSIALQDEAVESGTPQYLKGDRIKSHESITQTFGFMRSK